MGLSQVVYRGLTCFVETEPFNGRSVLAQLHHHPVERINGGQVPEAGVPSDRF